MRFGERLRDLRRERGWSQQTLAQRLMIARSHLSRLETGGVTLPSPAMRRRIYQVFGLTEDAFTRKEITLTDPRKQKKRLPRLSPPTSDPRHGASDHHG